MDSRSILRFKEGKLTRSFSFYRWIIGHKQDFLVMDCFCYRQLTVKDNKFLRLFPEALVGHSVGVGRGGGTLVARGSSQFKGQWVLRHRAVLRTKFQFLNILNAVVEVLM